MRTLAAIRTHNWDEDAEQLRARLAPVFGDDLVVVYHNRRRGARPPIPLVDLNDPWLAANGLRYLTDYGWRCGDYSFYALRKGFPQYDAYWLIEPDVVFTADPHDFFAHFADDRTDALGYEPVSYPRTKRFGGGLADLDLMKAIFALTRLSGRAIDQLFVMRQAYSLMRINRRDYANDEVFVYSNIAADPAMTIGNLADKAGDWFTDVQFRTDPDLLIDWVMKTTPPGKVLHPVRGQASFGKALARRLASNTGYLMRMRGALEQLSPAYLDDIAVDAALHLRLALQEQVDALPDYEEDSFGQPTAPRVKLPRGKRLEQRARKRLLKMAKQ